MNQVKVKGWKNEGQPPYAGSHSHDGNYYLRVSYDHDVRQWEYEIRFKRDRYHYVMVVEHMGWYRTRSEGRRAVKKALARIIEEASK